MVWGILIKISICLLTYEFSFLHVIISMINSGLTDSLVKCLKGIYFISGRFWLKSTLWCTWSAKVGTGTSSVLPPPWVHCHSLLCKQWRSNETAASPGQFAQLAGASSCSPKGCRLHFQAGCVWEATYHCFSLTLTHVCVSVCRSPSILLPSFPPYLPSLLSFL